MVIQVLHGAWLVLHGAWLHFSYFRNESLRSDQGFLCSACWQMAGYFFLLVWGSSNCFSQIGPLPANRGVPGYICKYSKRIHTVMQVDRVEASKSYFLWISCFLSCVPRESENTSDATSVALALRHVWCLVGSRLDCVFLLESYIFVGANVDVYSFTSRRKIVKTTKVWTLSKLQASTFAPPQWLKLGERLAPCFKISCQNIYWMDTKKRYCVALPSR